MQRIAWAFLVALHLIPIVPLFRPAVLGRMYGVEAGGVLTPLLQHRAALFLAVAAVCLLALFDPASRRAAALVAGISMVTFLGLYAAHGAPASLRSIAIADLIGVPFLLYVIWANFLARAPQ